MSIKDSSSTLADGIGAPVHVIGSGRPRALPKDDERMREHQNQTEKQYRPIKNRATSRHSSKQIQHMRSHHSLARSYSDGIGFHRASVEAGVRSEDNADSTDPEKQFEVRWEAGNDPMDPRSMSKPRKWLVVLIVSMSSLCV